MLLKPLKPLLRWRRVNDARAPSAVVTAKVGSMMPEVAAACSHATVVGKSPIDKMVIL
jgi:hypothetical protein